MNAHAKSCAQDVIVHRRYSSTSHYKALFLGVVEACACEFHYSVPNVLLTCTVLRLPGSACRQNLLLRRSVPWQHTSSQALFQCMHGVLRAAPELAYSTSGLPHCWAQNSSICWACQSETFIIALFGAQTGAAVKYLRSSIM